MTLGASYDKYFAFEEGRELIPVSFKKAVGSIPPAHMMAASFLICMIFPSNSMLRSYSLAREYETSMIK